MWNVVTIVEQGADAGALYPSAQKDKPGFALRDGETVLASHDAGYFKVLRRINNEWREVVSSIGNKLTFFVTNQRTVFVFAEVPKNRSMFTVVRAGQALAGIGKHKGESLVGHIPHESLAVVAVRKRSAGLSSKPGMIRLMATDQTDEGTATNVMVEINKNEALEIGHQISVAAVNFRIASNRPQSDAQQREAWQKAVASEFSGSEKDYQQRQLVPYLPIK